MDSNALKRTAVEVLQYDPRFSDVKKLPTQKTVVKVCNKILHLQVDGRDITSTEVEIILGYIEDEIGDYGFLNENFDNHETLTLMSQVRKIIAQANGGK